MLTKEIKTKSGNVIHLEYDCNRYKIEYTERSNLLVVKKAENDEVMKIFNGFFGFLVECDVDNESNFVLSELSKDETGEYKWKLKHFKDDGLFLNPEREFPISDGRASNLENVRLCSNMFLFEVDVQTEKKNAIYNLSSITKSFWQVVNNPLVQEVIQKHTTREIVLLTELKTAKDHPEIADVIAYGVDAKTLTIVTPIYSKSQSRLIPIYTKEEAKGAIDFDNKNSLARLTIEKEVQEVLDKKAKCIYDTEDWIFTDSSKTKVNEEFIKKLVNGMEKKD